MGKTEVSIPFSVDQTVWVVQCPYGTWEVKNGIVFRVNYSEHRPNVTGAEIVITKQVVIRLSSGSEPTYCEDAFGEIYFDENDAYIFTHTSMLEKVKKEADESNKAFQGRIDNLQGKLDARIKTKKRIVKSSFCRQKRTRGR